MPMVSPREPETDNIIRAFDLRGGEARGLGRINQLLQKSDKGQVYATASNIRVLLTHDEPIAGMFAFNEFIGHPMIVRAPPPPEDKVALLPGPYPRRVTETDKALVFDYILRNWCTKFTKAGLEDAILVASTSNRFHPVRDWLASLAWDGVPRLGKWLVKAFGADDTDYHNTVGAKVLIAAVRRVRQPGCKFDTLLILEGDQGIGKSRICRIIFGDEWFSDSMHPDLTSRDAPISLQGKWGIELAEIQHIIRNEVDATKAFLSRPVDSYRPVNGKSTIDVPRQSVMIGTTNTTDYLRDATGNRRYWPVRCAFADSDWIEQNRDQLWAEAAAREASGEVLWIDDAETKEKVETAQSDRLIEDVWCDPIDDFLEGKTETRVSDVLTVALNIPRHLQGRSQEMRVGGVLRMLGWKVKITKQGKKSVRLWTPAESQEAQP